MRSREEAAVGWPETRIIALGAGQTQRFRSQYDLFLKKLNPIRRIRELTEELSRTRRERDQARKESERLKRQTEDLQRELTRIQEENNQLRKELELAQRAAQPLRFPAAYSKVTPKARGVSPGPPTANTTAEPFPITSTNRSRYRFQGSVRIAVER
jgi:hypothetical protein